MDNATLYTELLRIGTPSALSKARVVKAEMDADQKRVARTILAQLGGNRFCMMTGARDFVSTKNSLTFRMPKAGTDKSNVWRITLMPSDTYKVETLSVRGIKIRTCSTFEDIYNDSLVDLFERVSGFYTSLGTMGKR